MYFSSFNEKTLLSWTLLISLFTFGRSDSADIRDKSDDTTDLERWQKDLNLNDELMSKLYSEVNDFLIRKDFDKDDKENHMRDNDGSFQVNIPNDLSSARDTPGVNEHLHESDHLKHKRSPCYGFQDSLSCFRSYLALWMLQRQGLKDPITLRNIGKRSYSFRNVGKRGRLYSFRNIGKRKNGLFRNIGKRQGDQNVDQNQSKTLIKREVRFPRSYFRNVGKRGSSSFRNIGKRMSFRNIGKRMSFRNIGKRNPTFERDNRMSFRNIGKRDPQFDRDERMSFRNIGKRDSLFPREERMFRNIGKRNPLYERNNRMSFRNIGKRDPTFERDDRMSFRNIGKKDQIFGRDERMAFRNIGKRNPELEADDRMAFRNIGKRLEDDSSNASKISLQNDADGITRTIRGPSFRNIGKRNTDVVKDMSDVL